MKISKIKKLGCRKCAYSHNLDEYTWGSCRRRAPKDKRGSKPFPMVTGDDWCGEFKLEKEE